MDYSNPIESLNKEQNNVASSNVNHESDLKSPIHSPTQNKNSIKLSPSEKRPLNNEGNDPYDENDETPPYKVSSSNEHVKEQGLPNKIARVSSVVLPNFDSNVQNNTNNVLSFNDDTPVISPSKKSPLAILSSSKTLIPHIANIINDNQHIDSNEMVNKPASKVDSTQQQELYCPCNIFMQDALYIGCDHCESWYHAKCAGLSKTESELIESWICPSCKEKGLGKVVFKPVCKREGCNNILPVSSKVYKENDNKIGNENIDIENVPDNNIDTLVQSNNEQKVPLTLSDIHTFCSFQCFRLAIEDYLQTWTSDVEKAFDELDGASKIVDKDTRETFAKTAKLVKVAHEFDINFANRLYATYSRKYKYYELLKKRRDNLVQSIELALITPYEMGWEPFLDRPLEEIVGSASLSNGIVEDDELELELAKVNKTNENTKDKILQKEEDIKQALINIDDSVSETTNSVDIEGDVDINEMDDDDTNSINGSDPRALCGFDYRIISDWIVSEYGNSSLSNELVDSNDFVNKKNSKIKHSRVSLIDSNEIESKEKVNQSNDTSMHMPQDSKACGPTKTEKEKNDKARPIVCTLRSDKCERHKGWMDIHLRSVNFELSTTAKILARCVTQLQTIKSGISKRETVLHRYRTMCHLS